MYLVICPDKVVMSKNLSGINKKLDSLMKTEDFHTIGSWHLVTLDKTDLEFVRDVKAMSAIPIKNLYKQDHTQLILIIINLLLTFILLVKG